MIFPRVHGKPYYRSAALARRPGALWRVAENPSTAWGRHFWAPRPRGQGDFEVGARAAPRRGRSRPPARRPSHEALHVLPSLVPVCRGPERTRCRPAREILRLPFCRSPFVRGSAACTRASGVGSCAFWLRAPCFILGCSLVACLAQVPASLACSVLGWRGSPRPSSVGCRVCCLPFGGGRLPGTLRVLAWPFGLCSSAAIAWLLPFS